MTFTYPAIITPPGPEGNFRVELPDLEGCFAERADLEDALQEAREAAEDWVRIELEEFEGNLPFASHPEDLELTEGQFLRQILVTYKLLPDGD
ncbi:MAG: type II toxin-antitoxin system HicB family antitoxin [Lachnospiraceae bacterium]|nr:type II toxin-antitoxin system HicB family antitoxin [Lachnospiraceae bacterium]